ncbi:hypothetical protein DE146DRAFT_271471 [Phaeosphaeria sp. MPI-PUGE-AT-0046c]|nr:hypothetical protein DE146DRAFT_271471 [Phaeosphaeria sp. MPI-PUGE-AT-0046c]
MAAAEYYMGTAHELPGNRPPQAYPSQPQGSPPPYQQQYPQQPYNTSYNIALPQHQPLPQTYPPAPPQIQHNYAPDSRPPPPYPTGPPQFPTGPAQQNTYLGPPLQPIRSHSQPARVHFAGEDDFDSSSSSRSRSSSPERRRRHRRHRSRDDEYATESRSGDGRRHRSHHETRAQRREHKDRDTFLGAGAGALVGDVIFPGLGTAAGILLGGLGGRKYARSKSEDDVRGHRSRRGEGDDGYDSSSGEERRRHRHGYEKRRGWGRDGWDEKSATYKSGTVIR